MSDRETIPGETAAGQKRLKTIGRDSGRLVRLKNRTSTTGSFVDGIRETRRDALKPLVLGQSPVVRLDETP